MDDQKALEQLGSLLDEISDFSNVTQTTERKEEQTKMSNLDVLQQLVSPDPPKKEDTVDVEKPPGDMTAETKTLEEIHLPDISNQSKQKTSRNDKLSTSSSSSHEEQKFPQEKETREDIETMKKSFSSKKTEKPDTQIVHSKTDARKTTASLHQRSQTMKPSSLSSSSTSRPIKENTERQKKPPSSSKSLAHLSRMQRSSSGSTKKTKLSTTKTQTLTTSNLQLMQIKETTTSASRQSGKTTKKEIETNKPRYIDNPAQVPDPVRVKKTVREIPETGTNPLPSILTIDLPDGNQRRIATTPDFTIQEVFDLLCDKLDLWQNDLFGLVQIVPMQSERFLLQSTRTLKEENITPETKLKLRVFWWKTPFKWVDPVARHFFYHEVKEHIINGDWPCSESVAIRLAAIQMQITYGDRVKSKLQIGMLNDQTIANFLPPYVLRSMTNIYAQQRVFYAYNRLQGFSTQDAQRLYLDEAKNAPTFGTTLFRGYYEAKFDRKIGVGEDGIFVQKEDESKWEFYSYRDLQNVQCIETGIKFVFTSSSFFHKVGGEAPNIIMYLIRGYYWILRKQETPGFVKKEFLENPPAIAPNYLYLKRPHSKDPTPISNLLWWKMHYMNRCKDKNINPLSKFTLLLDNSIDVQQKLEAITLAKSALTDEQLEVIVTSLEMTLQMTPDPLVRNDVAYETVVLSKNLLSVGRTVANLLTLSKVKYADLTKNRLGSANAPDGLAVILKRGNSLETLILNGNRLGNDGTKMIMQVFKWSQTLRSLGLANNEINADLCHYLAKFLKCNTCLTSLNLANNNLEDGMKELVLGLSQNNSLQFLNVSNVGMTGKASNLFAEWASSNSRLVSLNVSYNNFSSSSVQTLAKCASNNLTCFHVHKTNIGAIGTTAIIDHLSNNQHLKELYIGGNLIDKKGLAALCNVLKQNNTLQKLSIRNSNLPKEGLITLGQVLQLNTGLQMLDLSENKKFSSKEVVIQWVTTLQKNVGLVELNISAVGLDKESMTILGPGLKANNKLEILRLDRNKFGRDGMKELATNLKSNKKLRVLKIQDADLGAQDVLDFLATLGKDSALEVLNVKKNNNIIKNSKTLNENLDKFNYVKVSF
jgi:Ran GTPase-activating protein (RanGAP) involved in mRNA processing and transport